MTSPQADQHLPEKNRLANETSPYLLQHASNPVDWYPWGDEAISAAKDQEKPIFLSIGYSACHWCHVMEHESFENDQIATVMNEKFINIKVDREERPDLDQIYMSAVVALAGQGGWPMSVFLTPELKPFYGGTYWPPEARMNMPGFRQILEKVHEAWLSQRNRIQAGADELTEAVNKMSALARQQTELSADLLESAREGLLNIFDSRQGGFGQAPKFPHAMDLRLLLRLSKRFDDRTAREAVTFTLEKMSAGGIYDQIGGGFHRYSVDAHWLVPHFEKMLYDNALLASTYLEAYQLTKNEQFAIITRETLDYTLQEMTQPQGGFYSTQDADSEGVEGKFFVWTQNEILDHLSKEDAEIFCQYFDVSPNGNWEGKSILNRPLPHEQIAERLEMDPAELAGVINRCKETLFAVRSQRIAPGRDDKILISWNGLMIAAMAQAGGVLQNARYPDAARAAADFILDQMRDETGRLLHAYKDGRARFNAYLDDYAALIDALVELYQVTFEIKYLDAALQLAERMVSDFYDTDNHGFFYTASDHEKLITRTKDWQDNATPSGNGLAATALLKLGRITGQAIWEEKAGQTLEALSGWMKDAPSATGQSLIALDFLLGPAQECVIIEEQSDSTTGTAMLHALQSRFLPNKVVVRHCSGVSVPTAIGPLLEGKQTEQEAATVYLCQQGACGLPITKVEQLSEHLTQ